MTLRFTPSLTAARGRRALIEACRRADGQSALARMIGKRQSAVWNWLRTGLVDPHACAAIERVTGVSRAALRPDLAEIFSDTRRATRQRGGQSRNSPSARRKGASPARGTTRAVVSNQ